MSDIVERLRKWSNVVPVPPAAETMDEAAAEIERLRTLATQATPSEGSVPGEGTKPVPHQTCPHVRGTVTQHCSLNFTLTDAEREAIDYAWCSVGRDDAFREQHASELRETLEQLLERTK